MFKEATTKAHNRKPGEGASSTRLSHGNRDQHCRDDVGVFDHPGAARELSAVPTASCCALAARLLAL